MKKSLITFFLLLFLISAKSTAQQDKKEIIDKALTAYFALDRENIHVHLDKNIFLAGEETWFQGYVLQRKLKLPNQTTNVYCALLDNNGTVLNTKLLHCNFGDFSGNIKLDKTLPSGRYFLQFYTNWMNNFIEDESSVHEISILNQSDKGLQKINSATTKIEFFPEGGNLIRNTKNSVVVKISGCGNTTLAVKNIEIKNAKGELLKNVPVNKLGYGRFELVPGEAGLKAIVKIDDQVHEQALPTALVEGVALEVNNYSLDGKVIVKARVNDFSKAKYNGKLLYLLIHQDHKAIIYNLDFSASSELTLMLPDTDIFSGTNTIRIIDENLNQIAEKMIFQHPGILDITSINASIKSSEIILSGKMNNNMVIMSASVLPENTKTLSSGDNLYSSLLLSPYIKNSKQHAGRYYFESTSKARQYELDMYLTSQTTKYRWADIMNTPPTEKFKFDRGLTVKAKLPQKNIKNKNLVLRLTAPRSFFQKTLKPDENGEVIFEDLILQDSTRIAITVLEKREERNDIKPTIQVFNGIRTYNKMYKPEIVNCNYIPDENLNGQDLPSFSGDVIELEDINLEKTNVLKYQKAPGNFQLRGYKVGSQEIASFYYLLDFIRQQGFDVEVNGTDVSIFSRFRNSINGARPEPMVYMDSFLVMSYSQLFNVPMEDVEEIYLNPSILVPSITNKFGIIKIYMKQKIGLKKDSPEPGYLIKNGFAANKRFTNDQYAETQGKGFENFGIIDWESKIYTNQNGEFSFKIPYTAQRTIKVLIEGFSADGKLISQIKTININ